MELLALGLNRHETVMRERFYWLFHEVPEKENEKLHETTNKIISDQMKVPDLCMDNLHVCHCLGSSTGRLVLQSVALFADSDSFSACLT